MTEQRERLVGASRVKEGVRGLLAGYRHFLDKSRSCLCCQDGSWRLVVELSCLACLEVDLVDLLVPLREAADRIRASAKKHIELRIGEISEVF